MIQTAFNFDGHALVAPRQASIDERFQKFVAANPHVVEEFLRRAHRAMDAGSTRLSAQAIFSDMRRDPYLITRGEEYKMNDQFTAPMSRLAIQRVPRFQGMFELRTRRAEQ